MALRLWMRAVGSLYLVMAAVAAIVKLPIRVLGPPGALDHAAAGEPTARLLVDTWVTLGLEFAVVGGALWIASRAPQRAGALVWTVLGLELVRGIGTDAYMIAMGHAAGPHAVWIAIHAVVLATGVAASYGAERAAMSVQSARNAA